ncbi:MAG TPA: VOC family protein [Acidimicrobiales bacterium]|nr:VOC family protein [Acidimicrobiales bacterium]
MSFHPYVFFSDGQCAAAFRRYHEVFGGELQVMTNADVPAGVDPMPGAPPEAVMHASIQIGDSFLMGSDDPTGDGGPKTGVAVSFSAPDEQVAKNAFDALAEDGEVTMPFGATFFSKGFGMCVDRFGVSWMVDTQGEPAG